MPAMCGASIIFTFSNKIAIMFAHSAVVMIIEILMNKRNYIGFKHVDESILLRTLVFMVFSGILLNSMKTVKPEISW